MTLLIDAVIVICWLLIALIWLDPTIEKITAAMVTGGWILI